MQEEPTLSILRNDERFSLWRRTLLNGKVAGAENGEVG